MLRSAYTLLHRAIASAPSRAFHPSPPAAGIFDSLRTAASSRLTTTQEKAKSAAFDTQRAFLIASPTYTLLDHQRLLEKLADDAGVKSWRTMIMSEAQKSELAENLVDLKIVSAFSPAEAEGYKPRAASPAIDGKAKERAARELGTDVARVNRFLANYAQSYAIHEWLQGRKEKGEICRGRCIGVLLLSLPSASSPTVFSSRPSPPAQASLSPSAKRSLTCARWRTRCTKRRASRAPQTRGTLGKA